MKGSTMGEMYSPPPEEALSAMEGHASSRVPEANQPGAAPIDLDKEVTAAEFHELVGEQAVLGNKYLDKLWFEGGAEVMGALTGFAAIANSYIASMVAPESNSIPMVALGATVVAAGVGLELGNRRVEKFKRERGLINE